MPGLNSRTRIDYGEEKCAGRVVFRVGTSMYRDFAGICEFNRVTEEVKQDLLKAIGVAQQRGYCSGLDIAKEFQAFLVGEGSEKLGHSFHQIVQVEGSSFQILLLLWRDPGCR
jgi:hypothetical protein